ncbi:DNA-binding protein [Pandoraea pneumonica]|uniref:DNA-binding protein n=1 Tax=Pandoraea pneumonica TaxID=2508299 RepID=A0A5E4YLP2_9BURK|nr:helix-turn-helix domain-containing protein [Pandoraea pneumonica]VVE49641.1 DNA-binding protein [Pandoraea pneumonica]
MDSLIAASARALAAGDPLGALQRVALRDDPPALALRGIAMAQLGEYPRARELLKRAARRFGANEAMARARCIVADAEIALAMRDFSGSLRALQSAAITLDAHADAANAMLARLVMARRLLLLGRLDAAAQALHDIAVQSAPVPARLVAVFELIAAEFALRALRIDDAHAAMARAQTAADAANVPALTAELAQVRTVLSRPVARLWHPNAEQVMHLDVHLNDLARVLNSGALVVDACRRGVSAGNTWRPLARRPVLFSLIRCLAQAWPADVARETLIAEAFGLRRANQIDETHRARLRVEIGRLRALLKGVASIDATPRGFVLRSADERNVCVLVPPIDDEFASVIALLSDGAAWSTSAIALALDASQRTVQRALSALHDEGKVRAIGQARARRWVAPPLTEFTTILLLPAAWSFS